MPFSSAIPNKRANIAVLIDGDNAQPALLEKILLEVARYGRPTIRRIYGDWTTTHMNSWKVPLHDHAISPVQQFRNTVGKNATDSALIIDAMDILNSNAVGTFCIVSSDSDFTRLATRIREEGVQVIGIGKRQTPQAFVKACDVFIHTELLEEQAAEENNILPVAAAQVAKTKVAKAAPAATVKVATPAKVKTPVKPAVPTPKAATKKPDPSPPLKTLKKAFEMTVQEDGWAHLSAMGTALRQINPAFDSREFGCSTLSKLIQRCPTQYQLKRPKGPGEDGPYVGIVKPAK